MVDDNRENVKAVEETLESLAPKPSKIDRDRLMWLAGRASLESELQARHRSYLWPIVNCLSSVAAGMLLAFLVLPVTSSSTATVAQSELQTTSQPSNEPLDPMPKVVDAPSLPAPRTAIFNSFPPSMLSDKSSYLELRSSVLAYGADALPDRLPTRFTRGSSESNTELPTQQNLLREMLNNDRRSHSPQQAG